MIVLGRRYNIDDIIVIVLVVESMKFIYRGRFVIYYYIYMNLYLKIIVLWLNKNITLCVLVMFFCVNNIIFMVNGF